MLGPEMAKCKWGQSINICAINSVNSADFCCSLRKHALAFTPVVVDAWSEKNVLVNTLRIYDGEHHISDTKNIAREALKTSATQKMQRVRKLLLQFFGTVLIETLTFRNW
jgi:hypothetical protein